MKKIYVDQVSKIEKWESIDGRQFNSPENCKKWEESYLCTIQTEMNNVPHFFIAADELFPYAYSDDAFLVIAPRNLDDVFIANAWLKLNQTVEEENVYLTSSDIGKTKTIFVNCEGQCYLDYNGSFKNMLAQVIKSFGELQKKIEKEIAKKTNN